MLLWFFATNYSNYARWLPAYLRDMRSVDQMAPDVASEFKKRLFTVIKTPKRFSAIAIDQAHEQNNAMVKGDGGAVGLKENPNALLRWMFSGREVARLVKGTLQPQNKFYLDERSMCPFLRTGISFLEILVWEKFDFVCRILRAKEGAPIGGVTSLSDRDKLHF